MSMTKQPDEITVCTLACVLMPNGEVVCLGKTLGFFDKFKRYLTPVKAESPNAN